jgi:hypothetical protein
MFLYYVNGPLKPTVPHIFSDRIPFVRHVTDFPSVSYSFTMLHTEPRKSSQTHLRGSVDFVDGDDISGAEVHISGVVAHFGPSPVGIRHHYPQICTPHPSPRFQMQKSNAFKQAIAQCSIRLRTSWMCSSGGKAGQQSSHKSANRKLLRGRKMPCTGDVRQPYPKESPILGRARWGEPYPEESTLGQALPWGEPFPGRSPFLRGALPCGEPFPKGSTLREGP